jgi:hypothetical protein
MIHIAHATITRALSNLLAVIGRIPESVSKCARWKPIRDGALSRARALTAS